MSIPRSDEGVYALTLLKPGEWVKFEEIVSLISVKIPPGKALRKYEQRAAHSISKNESGERVSEELSDSQKIASGRRTLAFVALQSLKNSGLVIWSEETGERLVLRTGKSEDTPPAPRKATLLKAQALLNLPEAVALNDETDQLRRELTALKDAYVAMEKRVLDMETTLSYLERSVGTIQTSYMQRRNS